MSLGSTPISLWSKGWTFNDNQEKKLDGILHGNGTSVSIIDKNCTSKICIRGFENWLVSKGQSSDELPDFLRQLIFQCGFTLSRLTSSSDCGPIVNNSRFNVSMKVDHTIDKDLVGRSIPCHFSSAEILANSECFLPLAGIKMTIKNQTNGHSLTTSLIALHYIAFHHFNGSKDRNLIDRNALYNLFFAKASEQETQDIGINSVDAWN